MRSREAFSRCFSTPSWGLAKEKKQMLNGVGHPAETVRPALRGMNQRQSQ